MKFLQGSYGIDILSILLFLIGLFLNMFKFTYILGIAFIILGLYRALSKKTYLRKTELNKFIGISNKFLSKFNKSLPYNLPVYNLNNLSFIFTKFDNYLKQRKHYKIVKCPICAQKLRLPKGKGKVVITCSKCHNKFDSKS